MSFFSKLVKGVGKVVGGIGKVATGIVSKLNIPIISGAAGVANSLLSGGGQQPQTLALQQPITPPPQTQAQAATFGGQATNAGISAGGYSLTKDSWLSKKTIFTWAPNWVVAILTPGIVLLVLLYFIFKRRRR